VPRGGGLQADGVVGGVHVSVDDADVAAAVHVDTCGTRGGGGGGGGGGGARREWQYRVSLPWGQSRAACRKAQLLADGAWAHAGLRRIQLGARPCAWCTPIPIPSQPHPHPRPAHRRCLECPSRRESSHAQCARGCCAARAGTSKPGLQLARKGVGTAARGVTQMAAACRP
jgi:hypothetical protein